MYFFAFFWKFIIWFLIFFVYLIICKYCGFLFLSMFDIVCVLLNICLNYEGFVAFGFDVEASSSIVVFNICCVIVLMNVFWLFFVRNINSVVELYSIGCLLYCVKNCMRCCFRFSYASLFNVVVCVCLFFNFGVFGSGGIIVFGYDFCNCVCSVIKFLYCCWMLNVVCLLCNLFWYCKMYFFVVVCVLMLNVMCVFCGLFVMSVGVVSCIFIVLGCIFLFWCDDDVCVDVMDGVIVCVNLKLVARGGGRGGVFAKRIDLIVVMRVSFFYYLRFWWKFCWGCLCCLCGVCGVCFFFVFLIIFFCVKCRRRNIWRWRFYVSRRWFCEWLFYCLVWFVEWFCRVGVGEFFLSVWWGCGCGVGFCCDGRA